MGKPDLEIQQILCLIKIDLFGCCDFHGFSSRRVYGAAVPCDINLDHMKRNTLKIL
jgi:hypothetical protein